MTEHGSVRPTDSLLLLVRRHTSGLSQSQIPGSLRSSKCTCKALSL
jgi:hypothetical protein